MRHILTSTALVALLASPLVADSNTNKEWSDTFMENSDHMEFRATGFIGSRVYVAENDVTETELNDADPNWEDIGEINDVVMTRDGEIEAILVDVGGFLGLGEKTVAVQMDKLKLISDGDDANEYFVVFTANRELLESVPAFTKRAENEATMTDTEATAASDASAMEEPASPGGQAEVPVYPAAPMIEREGYETVTVAELNAEDLTGAAVYDGRDEWIGEVSELILNTGGDVNEAVIDVGGFLGIGEKPVAVNFESMTIKKQAGGDDLRVYVDATEEQLKNLPEHQS